MARLLIDLLLLLLAVTGPWYVFAVFLLCALFYFPMHYESLFAALAVDLLYGVPFLSVRGHVYAWCIAAVLLLLTAGFFKKRVRMRSQNGSI